MACAICCSETRPTRSINRSRPSLSPSGAHFHRAKCRQQRARGPTRHDPSSPNALRRERRDLALSASEATASAKEMPCFLTFSRALPGSHSVSTYVQLYTQTDGRGLCEVSSPKLLDLPASTLRGLSPRIVGSSLGKALTGPSRAVYAVHPRRCGRLQAGPIPAPDADRGPDA